MLPRVLIGITSYYAYVGVKKLGNKGTIGLLNLIWLFILAYLSYGIYQNIRNDDGILLILMNVLLIAIVLIVGYFTAERLNNRSLDLVIATIVGTLTNTIGVLSSIYFIC